MRRSLSASALLLAAALCPRPAAAQSCSAESISNSAIAARCGQPAKAQDGASPVLCKQYLMSVLNNCSGDITTQTDTVIALKKLPHPLSEADDKKQTDALHQIGEILEYQKAFSNNIAHGTRSGEKDEPVDFPLIGEYRKFEDEIVQANLRSQLHLDLMTTTEEGQPVTAVRTAPNTPGGLGGIKRANDQEKGLAVRNAAQLENGPAGTDPAVKNKALAAAGGGYLAGGDPAGAERVGKALAQRAPSDPAGPAILARAALDRNRPEEAADWARKALALDPKNKEAKDTLAFAESILSKSRLKGPGAKPGFDESGDAGGVAAGGGTAPARTAAPGPAAAPGAPGAGDGGALPVPPHLKLAEDKIRMGDYAGALADLTLALDQNPNDDLARLRLSELSNLMNNPESGLAEANRYLEKHPEDPRALRAKADALMRLGRLEEALTAIEKSLALEAGSGAGHLLRAMILEKLGRTADAGAEYREAARLSPALTPVAEEALRRLGLSGAPKADPALQKKLMRGGLIVLSCALLLLGLVGGARVVTRRSRSAPAVASADPDRTITTGDLVGGQYRVNKELGRGGMGVVFEAVDETLKRRVALKQMQGDLRVSDEDAARFLQEARLVAQLRHPNIAEIHAAVDDGGLFLVFELIEGKPLDQALQQSGTLDPDETRKVVADVCAGLSAAHERRIIHRDLKPSNVIITTDGVGKIMDFGIAHQSRGGAASTQTSASGTPPYMAPEQAMGTVLPASDLYALGVMAYELLAGKRPFLGPDFLGPKMRGEFVPVTRMRPGLPPGLDAFFTAALSPDPDRRPKDARSFRKAFDACWDASMPRTVAG